MKLVAHLDSGAQRAGRVVDVLLQVSLDPPGTDNRAGAASSDLPGLAAAVTAAEALRLRGLMAVAPLGADPAEAFAELRRIHDQLLVDHPEAGWLSAGMSADLEQAVKAGATHVRIGSAVLGSRPPVK
jgi:uncharacterized pyridoxal phosphate-containing UPF0001 family protein